MNLPINIVSSLDKQKKQQPTQRILENKNQQQQQNPQQNLQPQEALMEQIVVIQIICINLRRMVVL